MAKKTDSENSSDDQQPDRPSTEQEMLLREVDDAVRQDQFGNATKRYGIPAGILLVLALGSFGGWLYWSDQQEGLLEQGSEQLITVLDEIDAGSDTNVDEKLAVLVSDGSPGVAAAAAMTSAGLALADGRTADAVETYDRLATNPEAPQPYRDIAEIRSVSANFDQLEPQAVVDRLKPLAVPGNPWFGSAGELVAMAYLEQDRPDLAGPLFAGIAKSEDTPESLRARTRQMAGMLGYDAVLDSDLVLVDIDTPDAPAPPAED